MCECTQRTKHPDIRTPASYQQLNNTMSTMPEQVVDLYESKSRIDASNWIVSSGEKFE